MLRILQWFLLSVIFVLLFSHYAKAEPLPSGFVYLHDVNPTILQDMRYAGYHNFVGRPVPGYAKGQGCILTKEAANALSTVQMSLAPYHLSLRVYDCYRPTEAVAYFLAWSQDTKNQKMKAEFYPNINKADVFKLGYVAAHSGHSRGSTVDLTLVATNVRSHEANLDMGTEVDYLDPKAHFDAVDKYSIAYRNRMYLRTVMEKSGFTPYSNEWWHFVLKNEPYPHTYFNFTG